MHAFDGPLGLRMIRRARKMGNFQSFVDMRHCRADELLGVVRSKYHWPAIERSKDMPKQSFPDRRPRLVLQRDEPSPSTEEIDDGEDVVKAIPLWALNRIELQSSPRPAVKCRTRPSLLGSVT